MISIGIVSEYRASFYAPHHDVMQGTRSFDSRSPWLETPLTLPTLAGKLNNLTAFYQNRRTHAARRVNDFPLRGGATGRALRCAAFMFLPVRPAGSFPRAWRARRKLTSRSIWQRPTKTRPPGFYHKNKLREPQAINKSLAGSRRLKMMLLQPVI